MGFAAQIREDGVQVKLGTYRTAEEAATAVAQRHIDQNGGAPLLSTDVEVGSEHALRDALSSVNLQAYAQTFIDQEVQYEDLHNLSESDLLEIGISSEEITIV